MTVITGVAVPEKAYFLSEILGARVAVGGKNIGKLDDLIIKENGTLPVVTQLVVSLPFGVTALVPWDKIGSMDSKVVEVTAEDLAPYKADPPENAVLLKDHILDKKAIDLEGREMEVVYDVKLVLRNNKLYVSDVDLSRYGLLRRLGLKGLASFIYSLADRIREQTVSWTYIQPLPDDLTRFKGDLHFKVLKEKLSDMHPVDLADILEEMDPDQRVEIFQGLEPSHASDTLEEIDPTVQRDLVSSLGTEKMALLIDEMTPGQAADVLSVLAADEAHDILDLLNPDNAQKIQAIIERQVQRILDYATREYVAFQPDCTVEQAQDQYRFAAKGKDVVMYLYIVDKDERLLGVLDIKELLQADEHACLKDVMIDNVITLEPDSTLKEASVMFGRYGFRAIPIADEADKLLGVVTYRDVMGLKHRYVD